MPTQRKLVKKNKRYNIKQTQKHKTKISTKLKKSQQTGGAKNNNNNEIDIDDDDLLFNNNNNNNNNHAKTGAYNQSNNYNESTSISKALQERQAGLSLQYPGQLNVSQEEAMRNKLDNIREPGFPGLNINSMSQFKPKINYKLMYEVDLLSATLVIPKDEFNTESNESKSNNKNTTEEQTTEPATGSAPATGPATGSAPAPATGPAPATAPAPATGPAPPA